MRRRCGRWWTCARAASRPPPVTSFRDRSLTVWSGAAKPLVRRYRRAAKGHAEEMRALVDLCQGREPSPACDFVPALWSTLTTWRAVESAAEGRGIPVEPRLANLRTALGFPAR